MHITNKGFSRKSYAWTKRGIPAIVDTVLLYQWSLHEELTFEKPPFDLQHVHDANPKIPSREGQASCGTSVRNTNKKSRRSAACGMAIN